jgi:hypothetical protein
MKNRNINLGWNIVILSLLCGLLGGVGADLILRNYIFQPDTTAVSTGGEINLTSGIYGRSNVVIQDPKKVVVNFDLKIQETINAANDSLVGLYARLPEAKGGTDFNRSEYYDLSKPEWSGLALTADGWIMIKGESLNAKNLIANYVGVTKNKKIYAVDQALEYRKQGLWLIHLQGAENLLVKKMASAADLSLGQVVVAVNWNNDVLASEILSLPNRQKSVKSSDRLEESVILTDALDARFKNSWIFSLGGDLVALVDKDLKVYPVANVEAALYNFLAKGSFSNVFLGVNYSSLANLAKAGTDNRPLVNVGENGSIISVDESKVAVVKDSPAAKAGLKAGDIIVSLDNVELGADKDLAALVQSYQPEDIVTFKFLRGGSVQSVDIKLGELKQ